MEGFDPNYFSRRRQEREKPSEIFSGKIDKWDEANFTQISSLEGKDREDTIAAMEARLLELQKDPGRSEEALRLAHILREEWKVPKPETDYEQTISKALDPNGVGGKTELI